jgi:hypothetical protein
MKQGVERSVHRASGKYKTLYYWRGVGLLKELADWDIPNGC